MKSIKQRRNTTHLKLSFENPSYTRIERTCHSLVHPINESSNIFCLKYCKISTLQLLLWIGFVSCFAEQSLGETSRPVNLAAAKDEKVQLNCSTQDQENGYWKYTKPFEINERKIYYGDKVVNGMSSLFSVNDSVQGHFNLIFNALESTSGRYTCQPDVESTDQSAEVIVLESLNCASTQTSGIVNASCWIEFSGNWAPEIHWHSINGKLETNFTALIPNRRVTSYLILPLNETYSGVLDIMCIPTFALESKPQATSAINVPHLLNNCTVTIGSSYPSTTQETTTPTLQPTPVYIIVIVVFICFCVIATLLIGGLVYKRKNGARSSKERSLREAEALEKPGQRIATA